MVSLFMQEVTFYADNKEVGEVGLGDLRKVKKDWKSCGKWESKLSWETW